MTINKVIPLSIPDLTGNEQNYLIECIKSGYVSTVGSKVSSFEACLSDFMQINNYNVCALSSGTEALTVAIRASTIERDEHIIMPGYTFIATANSIYNAGCSPIVLDVCENDSYTLSSNILENFLKHETYKKSDSIYYRQTNKRIGGIISVSVLGHHPNLIDLQELCNKYNLLSIIDAAGAFGSLYKGKSIVDIVDFGTYSFNGNKIITAGAGGAVFSKDQQFITKVKHIASTARNGPSYTHDNNGFNARMTNVHAAIGIAQIERATGFIAKRRQIYTFYRQAFENTPGIRPFESPEWCISNHWLSAFFIENSRLDCVIEELNLKGILVSRFWKPIDLQPPYIKNAPSRCVVAQKLYDQLLVLPSSTSLDNVDLDYIVSVLKEALK